MNRLKVMTHLRLKLSKHIFFTFKVQYGINGKERKQLKRSGELPWRELGPGRQQPRRYGTQAKISV
jgi:hypothetical protein